MSNGLWNKRKRIQEVKQDAKILLDLKEENNFLYEILTDDNLDNYDARLKISRMNLLFALQKILYQKRLLAEQISLDEEIDCLVNWEEASKRSIEKYGANKNFSLKLERQELTNEINSLLAQKNTIQQQGRANIR